MFHNHVRIRTFCKMRLISDTISDVCSKKLLNRYLHEKKKLSLEHIIHNSQLFLRNRKMYVQ